MFDKLKEIFSSYKLRKSLKKIMGERVGVINFGGAEIGSIIDIHLYELSARGKVSDVAHLLKIGANPTFLRSHALKVAACNGHTECVKLLIPVSDPKDDGSWALCHAAKNGHADCVKLLIPVSDPKANDSYALRLAMEHGQTECATIIANSCGLGLVVDEIATISDNYDYWENHCSDEEISKLWHLQAAREEALALQSFTLGAPAASKKSGRL